MSYLRYLCLFAVERFCVLFFFILCTICCPFLIGSSVFSHVY